MDRPYHTSLKWLHYLLKCSSLRLGVSALGDFALKVFFIRGKSHAATRAAPRRTPRGGRRGQIEPLKKNRNRPMLLPCRFTSSIVKSAGRTANCWCVPAAGKAPPAPNAVPPNWPKKSPSLPPPPAGNLPGRTPAPAIQVPVVCAARAARIRIEEKSDPAPKSKGRSQFNWPGTSSNVPAFVSASESTFCTASRNLAKSNCLSSTASTGLLGPGSCR